MTILSFFLGGDSVRLAMAVRSRDSTVCLRACVSSYFGKQKSILNPSSAPARTPGPRVWRSGLGASLAFLAALNEEEDMKKYVISVCTAVCMTFGASAADFPAYWINNPGSAWNYTIPANATYSSVPGLSKLYGGLDLWSGWAIPVYDVNAQGAPPSTQRQVLYGPQNWAQLNNGSWANCSIEVCAGGNSAAVDAWILSTATTSFPTYNGQNYAANQYASMSTATWMLPVTVAPTANPARKFYFNATMIPQRRNDGHMAVLQPDKTVVETFGTIVLGTKCSGCAGQVIAQNYTVSQPWSLLDYTQSGVTASLMPNYAGILDDLEVSSYGIFHALAASAPATILSKAPPTYPAGTFDRNVPYSGSIPMGSRLAIPWSTDLSTIDRNAGFGTGPYGGFWSREGQWMAMAAQQYGIIIVDCNGGAGGIAIHVRANSPNPDPAVQNGSLNGYALNYDLNSIIRASQLVNQ
jgi:hypothetical protein